MKSLLMVLASLLIFMSCNKEEDRDPNSNTATLTFGHYYGFCQGEECIEIFKLTNSELSEDTTDQYPGQQFYNGMFIALSQEKFELTKDLLDHFPQDLFSENDSIIGMPDAGDWGGYYIEYNDGIRHRSWLMDKMQSNVPTKYHSFMDQMDQKILLLK